MTVQSVLRLFTSVIFIVNLVPTNSEAGFHLFGKRCRQVGHQVCATLTVDCVSSVTASGDCEMGCACGAGSMIGTSAIHSPILLSDTHLHSESACCDVVNDSSVSMECPVDSYPVEPISVGSSTTESSLGPTIQTKGVGEPVKPSEPTRPIEKRPIPGPPESGASASAEEPLGGDSKLVTTTKNSSKHPVRQWVSRTGEFTTDAQLVWVRDGRVQILKSNGHFSTFSASELSAADLAYLDGK